MGKWVECHVCLLAAEVALFLADHRVSLRSFLDPILLASWFVELRTALSRRGSFASSHFLGRSSCARGSSWDGGCVLGSCPAASPHGIQCPRS